MAVFLDQVIKGFGQILLSGKIGVRVLDVNNKFIACSFVYLFQVGEFNGSFKSGRILQDPSRFETPIEFANLKEIYKGTGDKLIIHIQDPHTNLSGQENLAKTLDNLIQKYSHGQTSSIPILVEG